MIDGEAELLEGFEFNISGKLRTTLSYHSLEPLRGWPVYLPQIFLHSFLSTCLQLQVVLIISTGAEIDLENETFVMDVQATAVLTWYSAATAVINLVNTVTANSTCPLFLAIGIKFYQEVNGQRYT